MVLAAKVVLLAAIILETAAFRVKPRKKSEVKAKIAAKEAKAEEAAAQRKAQTPYLVGPAVDTVAEGEPGQVDYIFNLGAPGAASPGLQNWRGINSCFPGSRVYHSEAGQVWGQWIDVVASVGNLAYYAHAWMDHSRIDVKGHRTNRWGCNRDNSWLPPVDWTSIELHEQERYIDSVQRTYQDEWYHNVSIFASRQSYIQHPETVFQQVQEFGWGLVGSALHAGGTIYGGKQITHLIQHPQTNECILTFQGTASVQGWIANFHFEAAHFCGMVEQDESCSFTWGTCATRNPKGSFVHAGFKERILAMIKTDDFQNNIRPHLGRCSRVLTVGHSLGGAVSELFAACASRAPKPGEYGHEDYQHMAWVKESPARLSYITETGSAKIPPGWATAAR